MRIKLNSQVSSVRIVDDTSEVLFDTADKNMRVNGKPAYVELCIDTSLIGEIPETVRNWVNMTFGRFAPMVHDEMYRMSYLSILADMVE